MRGKRWPGMLATIVDPLTYFQAVRLLHYYSYSHVRPRRKVTMGAGSKLAPNVSIRNGERIVVGAGTIIGERSYIWAGDVSGRITIGDGCLFGPEVFITASDYSMAPDRKMLDQETDERDVVVGNDVWLGARVFIGAGVTIGDGSVLGAGAVVTRSIPAGSIATGNPARVVRRREDLAPSSNGTDGERPAPLDATAPT